MSNGILIRNGLFVSWLVCTVLAGTGRTGFSRVGPNNFPFYTDEEKYMPVLQSDGGQLSGKLENFVPGLHCWFGLMTI